MGARGLDVQVAAARKEREAATAADVAEENCPVCEGLFKDAQVWLDLAVSSLDGVGAKTFQVGTVFPTELEAHEKAIAAQVNEAMGLENTETVRTEANRWLSKEVAKATGIDALPDGRPDVVIQVDTRFWGVESRANSLFVAGRYTKTRRDVPQTHWPCRRCKGRGCWECEGSGVRYVESVEEAIAAPARDAFGAKGSAFHGAGREDIDAVMLGTGRPFVVELKEPTTRVADLAALEATINARSEETGVGVTGLRPSDKDEVVRIKDGGYDKQYVAHCEAEEEVLEETLKIACASIEGVTLEQRTPERVSHRRADLVRKRKVHTLRVESYTDPHHFSLFVHADSGAYIKELVSGDDGRTTPSVTDRLGVPVRVAALDVVAILDKTDA